MANQPPGLNGINVLGYMGVNPTTPSNYKTYNRAPTTNDSMNFKIGDHWEWQDPQRLWVLVALIGGDATWKEIVFDAANTFVEDIGVAHPIAGVLNILGDGNVTTEGFGNTVGIAAGPTIALVYITDNGNAVPALNQLNVKGGPNINTSAPVPGGNTIDVNLNTSILQPFTTADASSGVYSLGTTSLTVDRFMYAFPENSTFLGRQAGNLAAGPFDAISNTGIGALALNVVTTGSRNSTLGNRTLQLATTAIGNVAIGDTALGANIDSSFNIAIGVEAQALLATGDGRNVCMGSESLDKLVNGAFNIALGDAAGSDYTTNESSNIIIGNQGTVGESNVIRIGTDGAGDGEQDACYVAGIYGRGVGGVSANVIIDNTGKLGTGAPPPVESVAFYAKLLTNVPNVTGDSTIYPVAFDTLLFNVGGGYNIGTNVFTAPVTGYYQFNASLLFTLLTPAMISWVLQFETPLSALPGFRFSEFESVIPASNTYQDITLSGSWMTFMNATETMNCVVQIIGGARVVRFEGSGAGNDVSSWSGILIGT